jgi:hypothetical protein
MRQRDGGMGRIKSGFFSGRAHAANVALAGVQSEFVTGPSSSDFDPAIVTVKLKTSRLIRDQIATPDYFLKVG